MAPAKIAFPALALVLFILIAPLASAIILEAPGVKAFPLGKELTGNLNILFTELLPQASFLNAYIDSVHKDTLSLQNYIQNESYYQFADITFDYNLTATGVNTWLSYPAQSFNYNIRVQGTCGGAQCCDYSHGYCWCDCTWDNGQKSCGNLYSPGSFPCSWSADMSGSDSVSGTDGLKRIGYFSVLPPQSYNNDTVWAENANNNPNVQTSMRAECGGSTSGYITSPDGWAQKQLYDSELQPISGTFDRQINIQPFDHSSLDYAYRKYGGPYGYPGGGIYKDPDGSGPQQPSYQYSPNEVTWTGSTGYIRINNYSSSATYIAVYLPPNGVRLCAYTGFSQQNTQNWVKAKTQKGAVTRRGSPYTRQWSAAELASQVPPPPCPSGCVKRVDSYGSVVDKDETASVQVSFSQATNTTTATTDSNLLARTYAASVNLADFSSLIAPVQTGQHLLSFIILYQGSELAAQTFNFTVCDDADKDGYCAETDDCNDNESLVYPGAKERCNGLDDNCNGQIDEDFWSAESRIGNPCGVGACEGYYVCTYDGSGVKCSSPYREGELLEICDDNIDNDCDGVTDERYEVVGGFQKDACFCRNGDTKPCGTTVGVCTMGYQVCANHQWGAECKDSVQASEESCNRLDDDCNGIIDDVRGGTSVQSARCACYGGGQPSAEVCNEIDDNCNSQTDEVGNCCSAGDSRVCGGDIGTCKPGIQQCIEGSWGPCEGGVEPTSEICYNSLDDDCDGIADEDCTTDITCFNGIKDLNEDGVDCGAYCPKSCPEIGIPAVWLVFSAIVLITVVGIGVLAFKGIL